MVDRATRQRYTPRETAIISNLWASVRLGLKGDVGEIAGASLCPPKADQ